MNRLASGPLPLIGVGRPCDPRIAAVFPTGEITLRRQHRIDDGVGSLTKLNRALARYPVVIACRCATVVIQFPDIEIAR